MAKTLASLDDAREYFDQLPRQLEEYFDDAYQNAFNNLMQAMGQFFDVAATVNQQAKDEHNISASEATQIGEHGFTLLLKLIDLMEKLDLPHKRMEIEQISLIFARWIIQHQGRLNHIEPLVNAFAHSANSMTDKASLTILSELMTMVVDASADDIKHDLDSANLYRPWRLLHINRGIVATRTHNIELMKKVFDEMLLYLPQEADAFFNQAIDEMDSLDYPPNVRELIEHYHYNRPRPKLH